MADASGAAADRLTSALAPATLAALPGDALARWLGARRWFGAKGRAPRAVRIARVLPLPWAGGPFALAVVEVELDGETVRCQVPLVARERPGTGMGEPGTGPRQPEAGAPLVDRGDVVLLDATEDETFRAGLLDAVTRGETIEGDGMRLLLESVRAASESPFPVPGSLPSRVSAAEQSNTSIVYGDLAILKLFRRLERGENPDVEIARFLATRTDFRSTPALLGVVRLEVDGAPHVAAMLSELVPGAGDAWAHALDRARALMRAPPPAQQEPPNPFAAEARELGRATRALHEALASDEDHPDFAPLFAGEEDVERWAAAAREQMERSLDLLAARAAALDARAQAPARALLGRRAPLLARLGEIADAVMDGGDAGLRIRHHGDFHLGQVLRARDGRWMIIDFEGEPMRPLEERRAKHSPLRDVAGMMRSFAYAAATAAMEASGAGVNPLVESRAARWEREARSAFLEGYLDIGEEEPDTLLPDSREGSDALLALFEIEKIFYELGYELNNRPEWAWIPLRGIAKLF